MKQTTYQTDLTDPEFDVIKPCLHVQRESKWPLIRIFNAILYVCGEGIKWRALPTDFGVPWQTVYWYFRKWIADETWIAVNEELVMIRRQRQDLNALPSILIIDSQSVKNSATATNAIGVDGGKKIKGRKRIIITDSGGNLLYVRVVAANRHDGPAAWRWWRGVLDQQPILARVQTIRADSHYAGIFKSHLQAATSIRVDISSELVAKASQLNMPVHKGRWVVERTNGWNTNSRRLARDYERLPACSEAFCIISSIARLIHNVPCLN